MSESKKDKISGFLLGPAVVIVGTIALWKNEGRFDYYRAAKATDPVVKLTPEDADRLVSYTGAMDRKLTMPGYYVESFTGFLTVERSAEIYAWNRHEDDEGHVSWKLEWMSGLESNSRNRGIRQELSSGQIVPPVYQVGELSVASDRIEFVDAYRSIPASDVQLSQLGKNRRLNPRGVYFYLSKRKSSNLGDERISFEGVPVPETATYFGKYDGRGAVAHQAQVKGGYIDNLIQDTGVLHHIVAGERDPALGTMKSHLFRLKWMVRGAGFVGISIGFMILLGSAAEFLYHLPLISSLVHWGVVAVSIILGFAVSIVTIILSYLLHHPVVLVCTVLALAIVYVLSRHKAYASQKQMKAVVERQVGHSIGKDEMAELEFIELVKLARIDHALDLQEKKYLKKWAKRHGWKQPQVTELIKRAKSSDEANDEAGSEKHLRNLVQLALADGNLSFYEFNAISKAAKEIGFNSTDIQRIVRETRDMAIAV